MSSAVDMLQSMGERFQTDGSVKKVFGDPIAAEGKTVVPVASVRYGFGAGGGGNTRDSLANGGGGGGLRIDPLGVLEITATETRFIPFFNPKRTAVLVGAGFLLGKVFGRRRRKK